MRRPAGIRRAPPRRLRASALRQPRRTSLAGRRNVRRRVAGAAAFRGARSMNGTVERLRAAVQANCHVTDARHARSMTLCTYLLEMRELYRWERGAALGSSLPRAEVGAWIAEREALWETLEGADYQPLPLDGGEVDPYDIDAVNRALAPCGLVYGAGIGRFGKPQFFLGVLEREESRDGMRVLVAGRELARDLSAAPAAMRDETVSIRLESLLRVLWERVEAWTQKRREGALKAALDAYGYEFGNAAAIERMAAAEVETLILHELGERAAGRVLGGDWERCSRAWSGVAPRYSREPCATTSRIASSRCPRCSTAGCRRRFTSGSRISTACGASYFRARFAPTRRGATVTKVGRCARRSPRVRRTGAAQVLELLAGCSARRDDCAACASNTLSIARRSAALSKRKTPAVNAALRASRRRGARMRATCLPRRRSPSPCVSLRTSCCTRCRAGIPSSRSSRSSSAARRTATKRLGPVTELFCAYMNAPVISDYLVDPVGRRRPTTGS